MKDIKNYEGLYAVTSCGKVWSYKRQKFLRACPNGHGYYVVNLHKDKKQKVYAVHRLVIEAYKENVDSLPEVNHRDEDKANNCINNLEWCTREYNVNYGSRTEKQKATRLALIREGKSAPLGRKPKKVYCVELDKTFVSVSKAQEELGISNISICCKGKQRTSGGYHWRYAS